MLGICESIYQIHCDWWQASSVASGVLVTLFIVQCKYWRSQNPMSLVCLMKPRHVRRQQVDGGVFSLISSDARNERIILVFCRCNQWSIHNSVITCLILRIYERIVRRVWRTLNTVSLRATKYQKIKFTQMHGAEIVDVKLKVKKKCILNVSQHNVKKNEIFSHSVQASHYKTTSCVTLFLPTMRIKKGEDTRKQ